jgi:transcription termination factor Rho
MNEENQNQPPLEAGSTAASDQRARRPRRRYPRRRFYNRGERSDNSNSSYDDQRGGSPDPATATAEPGSPEALAQDRQLPGEAENGDQVQREPEFGEGIIEISGKGFGFLRDAKRNFIQTPQDIFVTPETVRRFALRDGMWIYGETRRGNRGRRRADKISGTPAV